MLKVTAVEEVMKVGATFPLRVICSDSQQYILKAQNDYVINGKMLFNEVIANRFAKLVDIPTPPAAIGILPKSIILNNKVENLEKYGFKDGKCFLSKYIPGTSLPINPISLRWISNVEVIPNLILFDTILMNSDRDGNPGNWFREKSTKKLIAIDHSNIFRLAQVWNKDSLKQDETIPPEIIDAIKGSDYKILMQQYEEHLHKNGWHHRQHQHPFSVMGRKINLISKEQIQNCFINIPQEWDISDEDKKAAINFLEFQVNHIDDIILELEQLFQL